MNRPDFQGSIGVNRRLGAVQTHKKRNNVIQRDSFLRMRDRPFDYSRARIYKDVQLNVSNIEV